MGLDADAHPIIMSGMNTKIDNERYKIIPPYPDYAVSRSGKIIRVTPRKDGRKNKPLSPQITIRRGYPERVTVGLFPIGTKRNRPRTVSVARMMLEAWVSRPARAGLHAAHRNGDATDNRLANLYWATPKQNCDDKFRHGTICRGEKTYNTTLTEKLVRKMRQDRANGCYWSLLSRRYGISVRSAREVCSRRTWKHVS